MNKKFSTLMASLLLASAFSTSALAAVTPGVSKDLKGKTVVLYESTGGTDVLSLDAANGELRQVAAITAFPSTFATGAFEEAALSLWKVASVKFDPTTGIPVYQFVNKKTGAFLAINLKTDNNGDSNNSVKLNGAGNKNWSLNNGVLYTYANDSIYTLKQAGGKFYLQATKGATLPTTGLQIGTDVTTAAGLNMPLTADAFNEMMKVLSKDGKLHFNNSKDVTKGEENLLTANQYVAYQESSTNNTFFLAVKDQKTSVNNNPYVLVVDKSKHAPALNMYNKLAVDTLAISATDAAKIVAGTANDDITLENKVAAYKHPVDAASFSAVYYYANDSIALQVAGVPGTYTAGQFAVTNGEISWSDLGTNGSANATLSTPTAYTGIGTPTTTPIKELKAAVDAWLAKAQLNASSSSTVLTDGYDLKFANSTFTPAGVLSVSGTKASDATGVLGAALAYVNNSSITTTAAEKAFVAAVAKLERKAATGGEAFVAGLPTPAAVTTTPQVPFITQLSSTKVLTVDAATNKAKYITPLVQPYAELASGDADITAGTKLFYIQLQNTDHITSLRATAETGKYLVENPIAASGEWVESVSDYNPYAQWAFIANGTGSYSIVNRGSERILYNGMVSKVKDADGKVVADTYVVGADTLKLAAVDVTKNNIYTEDGTKYDYVGYFYAGPQAGKTMSFEVAPVSSFMSTLSMQVNPTDSTLILGDAADAPVWYFDEEAGAEYGLPIAGMPRLKNVAYKVYTKDADGNKYYVVSDARALRFRITHEKSLSGSTAKALTFRTVAENSYLISDGTYKMTINPTPAKPLIEATPAVALKNDYFSVGKSTANIYRKLTDEDVQNGNAAIYMNNEVSRYLYENSQNIVANNGNKVAKDSLNFLGIFNEFELDKNPTLYVDTAYVERDGNIMPQYMFALGVNDVPASAGVPCTYGHNHYDNAGNKVDAAHCSHATPATKGYKEGRYLVSVADSAAMSAKHPANYDGATRFAFVPAKHYFGEDSLVIDNSKFSGTKNAKNDTLKIADGALNEATFALLIKDQADQSFYLETKGGYVRILNGVPVLTNNKDNAAIFNIVASELEATANEAIEASEVVVIAGKGVVTVQGAAGKVITVANILGQTIANQVAVSDNVTIAAPAGVVVVTVDGEATKVVVK